ALGYPAHLATLTRTESDHIHINDTITFSELEKKAFSDCTFPIVDFLTHIPTISVEQRQVENIMNGQRFYYPNQEAKQYKIMYNDILLGIFEQDPKQAELLKPKRIFRLYHKE